MINCAILVGCKKYNEKSILLLEDVDYDIIKMKQALIHYCDCLEDNISIIADIEGAVAKPTNYEIIKTVTGKGLEYKKTKINNLFFYYSGHGFISDDEDPVIMPTDSLLKPIIHGTLPLKTIIELIRKSFKFVNQIVFILDMCQTSLIAKGGSEDIKNIKTDYFPKGVIVFHSCFPKSRSYMIPSSHEDLGKGSVFTTAFIESLKNNSCYTVQDVSNFIKQRMYYYNSSIGIRQKPYTSLQDDTLGDVLIKKRGKSEQDEIKFSETEEPKNDLPDDTVLITFEELQEFHIANTFNTEFSEDEIRSIVIFADEIDCNNLHAVSVYGQSVLDKMAILYSDQIYNKYKITLDGFKNEKNFLKNIYSLTTPKNEDDSLKYNYQKIRIDDTKIRDTSIEKTIEKIKKSIQICQTQYIQNALYIEKAHYHGLKYLKELEVYIIAGTIVLNRNHKNELLLFQNILDVLRNNYSEFENYLSFLSYKTKMSYDHSIKFKEFLRKVRMIEPFIYMNKRSRYYIDRYNSNSLSELLEILNQIEKCISVYSESYYPH